MDNHLDAFFTALSDPTRRAVIERLVAGPAAVGELHAPHPIALPSFLKHINKLEEAGLVRTIKTGRTRMVQLEAAPLQRAEDWLTRQRRLLEGRVDRLAVLAEALDREGNV